MSGAPDPVTSWAGGLRAVLASEDLGAALRSRRTRAESVRVLLHMRMKGLWVALPLIAPWGACCETAAQPPAKKAAGIVAELAAKLEPTRVVTYKTIGASELRLHVFEPEGFKASDARPCFLAIHGGGWVGGDARRFYPFAAHFAQRGFVGISIEYRLMKKGNGVTPFDCVKDGRSAVRFVRSRAKDFGIDPGRIAVCGGSAGGHVAAGTALFDGIDEAGEDTGVRSAGDALVLLFPVIDTSSEGYGNAKCGERWRDISPVHRVKAGAPPTIIFHGTADTTTPFAGAKAFHASMVAAGNRCELVVNEGGKHGYLMSDPALYHETMRRTEEFLAAAGFSAGR